MENFIQNDMSVPGMKSKSGFLIISEAERRKNSAFQLNLSSVITAAETCPEVTLQNSVGRSEILPNTNCESTRQLEPPGPPYQWPAKITFEFQIQLRSAIHTTLKYL